MFGIIIENNIAVARNLRSRTFVTVVNASALVDRGLQTIYKFCLVATI